MVRKKIEVKIDDVVDCDDEVVVDLWDVNGEWARIGFASDGKRDTNDATKTTTIRALKDARATLASASKQVERMIEREALRLHKAHEKARKAKRAK